jgi:hypothetical protein
MKKNLSNLFVIISLNLVVFACSKLESNDMAFKKTFSSENLSTPVPGQLVNPASDPSDVLISDPDNIAKETTAKTDTTAVTDTTTKTDTTTVTDTTTKTDTTTVTDTTTKTDTTTVTDTTTKTDTTAVTDTTKTDTTAVTDTTTKVDEPKIYPESEIPVCRIDLTLHGLGSAARVIIASAPKADLQSSIQKGFEGLSGSELAAMRSAVESMTSSAGVQSLNADESFNKELASSGKQVKVVIQGNSSRKVDMPGLGKDAEIYIMIVSPEHNTICLTTDGESNMGELDLTVLSGINYAARASVHVNGNDSINSFMKVSGGHRSGSSFNGKSISGSGLIFITEGLEDTFSSINGNGISNSEISAQVKGKNLTGFGLSSNFLNNSKMKFEIEGQDTVGIMMDVKGKMTENEVSGWIKAKSGAKVDPSISEQIEIMPLP